MTNKIIKLNKFSDRIKNSSNNSLIRRKTRLEDVEYEILGHEDDKLDKENFIFTISIITYNRYEYAKNAINSVLSQTYKNIELILVDQCADEQVSSLCNDVFKYNSNVKLIRTKGTKLEYKNFQFPDDIDDQLVNLYNAALFVSIGDGIFGLCDDDCLNEIYIEKIVDLFLENKNCVTAGSAIEIINEHGVKNEIYFSYTHDRYMSAKSFIENLIDKKDFFSAPGYYFCVRSEIIIQQGGWDNQIDWSPIFRFMICGDHGYDKNAILYWRHHIGQAHWISHGCVMYNSQLKWLIDYNVINNIADKVDNDVAQKFKIFYNKNIFDSLKMSLFWAYHSACIKNIIVVTKEIRRQVPDINIYKHVSIGKLLKTYLFAKLLEFYAGSPVSQKYWKKIKKNITIITNS